MKSNFISTQKAFKQAGQAFLADLSDFLFDEQVDEQLIIQPANVAISNLPPNASAVADLDWEFYQKREDISTNTFYIQAVTVTLTNEQVARHNLVVFARVVNISGVLELPGCSITI